MSAFSSKGWLRKGSLFLPTLRRYYQGKQTRVSRRCSPHDDLDDFHGRVIQRVEEIHQNLPPFSHLSNDKSEDEAKDNQAEDIDAIWVLAHDFVFLCLVLWIKTMRIHWSILGTRGIMTTGEAYTWSTPSPPLNFMGSLFLSFLTNPSVNMSFEKFQRWMLWIFMNFMIRAFSRANHQLHLETSF